MKNFFILIFSFIFLILSSCEEDEKIDLTGKWLGEGYQCPTGVSHNEEITISHNLDTGNVKATKVTGDRCVTSGNITFTGVYRGEESSFSARFVTGKPSSPNSSTKNMTIIVESGKSMRTEGAESIVFSKIGDGD